MTVLERRDFLLGAAASAAALVVAGDAAEAAASAPIPDANRMNGWAIGCQAYSFNRFSAFEAIEKTAQAGGRVIEFYPGQKLSVEQPDLKLDERASDETIAKVKERLQKSNVLAAAFGVVNLGNNEASNRRHFDFAKKMGIGTITAEPNAAAMDQIERLVKEYDIRIAIHNHPRNTENANYRMWDPKYVLSLVRDRDKRMGACADTGHWVRSGIKPVDALRVLKGRVLSSHLKDINTFTPDGKDVPFGTGIADVRGMLDELRRQKFDGVLSIEYEANWENSVPDIAQCVGYVRGYAQTAR